VKVGVLALAAGRARRFGSDKRVARLPDGRHCIEAFLDQVSDSGLPALVCLAPGEDALAKALDNRDCPCHLCAHAAAGMGATLADGIKAVTDWDGVLVALADMPWITAGTYRAVAHSLAPGRISIPVFEGQRGHPVGFSRAYFPAIAGLGGDAGARDLLRRYAASVDEVRVADPAILKDIDLPEDIAAGGRAR
jgi:molybdenum cofactor cytidylyltransferase